MTKWTINRLATAMAVVWLHPSTLSATIITGTLDGIPPPQSVHYVGEVTGAVNRRLSQNDVRSTCSGAKAFPGFFSVVQPYRYDAYTFTASETRCLTVRVQKLNSAGAPYLSAYSDFDPGDVSHGYLADSGTPGGFVGAAALSLNVTAGQTYTVVVTDASSLQPSTGQYELTFDEPFTGRTDAVLDATAPASSPRYFGERTGTIAGARVFRDGVPSSCGVARAFPGVAGTGPFRFDAVRFVAPLTGCVTVSLRLQGGFGSVHAYANEFDPIFVGTGWLAEAGVGVTSPFPTASLSLHVVAGQTYALVVVNAVAGQEGLAYELVVSVPAQPPRRLRTAVQAGQALTFRWAPPIDGPPPTGYVLEGGVAPGQVLASVPTSGSAPITTLAVPSGAYYVRARTVAGAESSGPSNEIRVFVNTPAPPSPPVGLTGLVNGSALTLSWGNTFEGAPPTGIVLEVTGAAVAAIPLPPGEGVAFAGAPGGSYTLRVRAVNAAGASAPSNAVTVHVPSQCSGGPQPPANFLAYRVGTTVVALWDPPTTGPAATSFVLDVSGSVTASVPTAGRTLRGPLPPGSYTLTVRARNACGTSVGTPVQTVALQPTC